MEHPSIKLNEDVIYTLFTGVAHLSLRAYKEVSKATGISPPLAELPLVFGSIIIGKMMSLGLGLGVIKEATEKRDFKTLNELTTCVAAVAYYDGELDGSEFTPYTREEVESVLTIEMADRTTGLFCDMAANGYKSTKGLVDLTCERLIGNG